MLYPWGIMKIIRNYWNSVRSKRQKIEILACVLILIVFFENCSKQQISKNGISLNSEAGSIGLQAPPSMDMPVVPDPMTSTLPLSELQKICKSTITNPNMTDISLNEISIRSGLGMATSGNEKSSSIKITVDRGIKDPATFTKNVCDSQFSMKLSCSVLADDPNRPVSIANAIDVNGASLMNAGKKPSDLATGSVILNNRCNVNFAPGQNSVNFIIEPNSKTNERCVQGSFWLKLTAESQMAGSAGSNMSPTIKYLKVNVNNGCWNESQLKDSAGNLAPVINFGTAVAISNGWAAVLAPTDDSATAIDTGSVRMYKFDGANWIAKDKILVGDALARESINSIALRGDTMVLGSPYRNGIGAAFFYRRSGDTWNLIQRIDPPDQSQRGQDFGFSVALTDASAFVSSPNYSVNGMAKAGSVAVYNYSAGGAGLIKNISGSSANSAFGYSLSADAGVVAVGAPQSIGKELSAEGSVLVFADNSGAWNLVASKKGTTLAEKFGATVFILGNKLLVGSPNFSAGNKASAGRATFFSDLNAAATKTWDGSDAGGNMGQGLALSATGLYVGSPLASTRTGYVDHYLYTDLANVYYHAVSYNETPNSAFGWAVAAAGNEVIIGARIKNDPNDNSGAAFIYRSK